MNFTQAYAAIRDCIERHPDLFSGVEVDFVFGPGRPAIGDWSDSHNIGILTTGDGIGSKSGLYFFASPEEEITYIGKATKNNLHDRVWHHVKTPEDMASGLKVYPNHGFGVCPDAPEQVTCVQNGKARLGVVTVSDPVLVSFLEVYLHTVHTKQKGQLPVLNKQIG